MDTLHTMQICCTAASCILDVAKKWLKTGNETLDFWLQIHGSKAQPLLIRDPLGSTHSNTNSFSCFREQIPPFSKTYEATMWARTYLGSWSQFNHTMRKTTLCTVSTMSCIPECIAKRCFISVRSATFWNYPLWKQLARMCERVKWKTVSCSSLVQHNVSSKKLSPLSSYEINHPLRQIHPHHNLCDYERLCAQYKSAESSNIHPAAEILVLYPKLFSANLRHHWCDSIPTNVDYDLSPTANCRTI